MLDRLKRFFGSPPGGNDATTVRARLLSRVLNVHVMVALSVAAFYPGDTAARRAVAAAAIGTIPMALLMRAIMHRGGARVASWTFLILLSIAIPSLSIYVSGSVALVSVSIFQMMLIVMAGLLLGGKEAIAFAALIVATNGVLFRVEGLGAPDRAAGLYAAWVLQVVFYIATAALLARAIALTEELFGLATREAADRLAAEAALRESMERYRLITAVSSDYTFSTDFRETQGLQLNWVAGAFEAITGFTFDEYVARGGWRAALHQDDVAQDARDLDTLRQNRPVASELRTVCKDGTFRWVRIYALPVWDEKSQKLSGIYGAVQDISARKAAEAEREALIRELEARNAELERFTYTVSQLSAASSATSSRPRSKDGWTRSGPTWTGSSSPRPRCISSSTISSSSRAWEGWPSRPKRCPSTRSSGTPSIEPTDGSPPSGWRSKWKASCRRSGSTATGWSRSCRT